MIAIALSSLALAPATQQANTPSKPPARVQVSIDANGHCQVLKSSGNPQVDAKTCGVIKDCAAKSTDLKTAMAHCDTTSLGQKPENEPK